MPTTVYAVILVVLLVLLVLFRIKRRRKAEYAWFRKKVAPTVKQIIANTPKPSRKNRSYIRPGSTKATHTYQQVNFSDGRYNICRIKKNA
jgi:hypothetical protein